MIKVVLSGIFYPMAILRYFEAALERREDVELYTLGAYTGRQIPWGGGMLLSEKYARSPDYRVPQGSTIPFEFVERQLKFKPDLWLQIDAGFQLVGKPCQGINAIVATDPHVLDYTTQRSQADKFFCMQRIYSKPGDVYLPYAYDPVWHRSLGEVEKDIDVILLGLHYEQRNLLVRELVRRRIIVHYVLGPVFEEAHQLYERSRVGLNWSSLLDLNARVFEIMGMGLPLVTNRVPDMGLFFEEGRDYLGFESVKEGAEAVVQLITDPKLASQIARAGHRVVKDHTWDARITQIFEEVGLE